MRRVVITGIGIVSSLGNNKKEVKDSLYNCSSGISFDNSQKEMGFRSQVSGQIKINLEEIIERKFLRFMGCLLYTSPSPRDKRQSRMPSSA